jgi:carboxymethylenebutenolidase
MHTYGVAPALIVMCMVGTSMSRVPGYLSVALTLLWLGSAAAEAQVQVREEVRKYRSGARWVTVECFYSSALGKYPAVLLLHGSGGLEDATGDLFREIARGLVQEGYVVLIPHFFERTGHVIGARVQSADIPLYVSAVHDAIEYAVTSRIVDPERIGLVGWSFGSYLAFFRSARDPRVKAIVSISGDLPVQSKSKFPPVLVLQGSDDRDTSSRRLKQFQEKLEANNTPFEAKIYQGVGHALDPPSWSDATRRSAAFFGKHLK